MAKPTEEQLNETQDKYIEISMLAYELEKIVPKFKAETAAFTHSEIPEGVFNRMFTRETSLKAEIKRLAKEL